MPGASVKKNAVTRTTGMLIQQTTPLLLFRLVRAVIERLGSLWPLAIPGLLACVLRFVTVVSCDGACVRFGAKRRIFATYRFRSISKRAEIERMFRHNVVGDIVRKGGY